MRSFFSNIITAFALLFSLQLSAQDAPLAPCGTHEMTPWLNWYHDHKQELAVFRDIDSTWLYVPVTIHLVSDNDGINRYSEGEAFRIICELNEQYAPLFVRFYLMPGEGFVYHSNTNWNSHDWAGGAEMIETTKIPGRLNCYIVVDPAGNCGYSWYDAIVMARSCSGVGNSTWAHEAGHHFSLPHPFYGWEGHSWNYSEPAPEEWDGYPVEKTDGSNCYESGDRFCDTKPDYLNYRWGCNGNSLSTLQQKDPNGVSFVSDGSLYMSYASDACASRFSPEQQEAIRANLYTEHEDYLQITEPLAGIPENALINYLSPIDTAIEQYNNVWLQWEAVPGAEFYQVQVSTSPNFSVYFNNTFVQGATSLNITRNLPNNKVLYWRVRAYSNWNVCHSISNSHAVFRTKNLSATNELERLADISLNPNPVMQGTPFYLKINTSERLDLLLSIHDAAGRQCYHKETTLYSGDNVLTLPSENMNAGLYFVTLQTTNGTLIKRLAITE